MVLSSKPSLHRESNKRFENSVKDTPKSIMGFMKNSIQKQKLSIDHDLTDFDVKIQFIDENENDRNQNDNEDQSMTAT